MDQKARTSKQMGSYLRQLPDSPDHAIKKFFFEDSNTNPNPNPAAPQAPIATGYTAQNPNPVLALPPQQYCFLPYPQQAGSQAYYYMYQPAAEVMATPGDKAAAAPAPYNIGADNNAWNRTEDGTIAKLRTDGETWTGIAKAINRDKSDCKKRYEHLNMLLEQRGKDMKYLADKWVERQLKHGLPVPKPEKKHKHKDGKKEKMKQKDEADDDDESDDDQAQKTDDEDAHKKHKEQKKKKKKKKKKVVIVASASEESDDSSSSSTDMEEEMKKQKYHIFHDVYGSLYPPRRIVEPDQFWSVTDCKILAIIEAKQEALKWKYMQAEFFNATGRMVHVDLIKHKMGASMD